MGDVRDDPAAMARATEALQVSADMPHNKRARFILGAALVDAEKFPAREDVVMRYAVKRTSGYGDDDQPPCAEAVKGTMPRWDVRTFKSFAEFDEKLGERSGAWLSRGTEHQVIRGPRGGATGIKRRVEDQPAWFIELDSLEALMAFYEKYGDLVISGAFGNEEQPCIEIYDDYRE